MTRYTGSSKLLPSAEICHLTEALVSPLQTASNPAKVLGGVIHPDLKDCFNQFRVNQVNSPKRQLENITQLDRVSDATEKTKHLKGTHIYAGPMFIHFGHFLAESIHRLWALEYICKHDGIQVDSVLLLNQPRPRLKRLLAPQLPPICLAVLEYLGVPKSKIQFVTDLTRVENLIVPQQASYFRSQQPINQAYKSFLLRCEDNIEPSKDKNGAKKVYVSRSHFLLKGSYAGEAFVESLLAKHGYRIFYPENFSLQQQLAVYKEANELIFAEGSALHVLELLGNIDAKVAVIARRPTCQLVFEAMIKSRASNYTFFSEVAPLQSLFFPKVANSPAASAAIGVLELSAFARFIDTELGLKLANDEIVEFEKCITNDIRRYLSHHQMSSHGDPSSRRMVFDRFKQQVKRLGFESALAD